MNGASFCEERPLARPEKTANSVGRGTAEVTIAITNAIDSTAPVFCSSVRAPAAIPRRLAGTVPIIAAVLGLLNIPEPTPDEQQPQRALPVGGVHLQRGHRGEAAPR